MDLEQAIAEIEKLKKNNETLSGELDSLKNNNSSLVEEKRRETEAKQALQAKADEAAAELAKKNGDYETLARQAQEKEQKTRETLEELQQRIAQKEVDTVATSLATELGHDNHSAKVLKKFISERLQFADDELRILSEDGTPSTATIQDLQKEISEAEMFQRLIKGNSATGGRPASQTGRPGQKIPNDETLSPVQRINRSRGIEE